MSDLVDEYVELLIGLYKYEKNDRLILYMMFLRKYA